MYYEYILYTGGIDGSIIPITILIFHHILTKKQLTLWVPTK